MTPPNETGPSAERPVNTSATTPINDDQIKRRVPVRTLGDILNVAFNDALRLNNSPVRSSQRSTLSTLRNASP